MARLEIHLLGPLQVLLDGSPVSFESSKVRALLAVLAGEAPRPQFRESLAGLIWPDWPQQSAMSNLRYALADLRKNTGDRDAKPPFFIINRESIQVDLESDVTVDAVEFLKTGDPDCYRGCFLEGFSLPDSPEFTEWLEAKRSYYQQQVLEMLGKKAISCEQSGDYEQGLAYARRQLSIEPWLEEAHRQVMQLLALSGQRGAALAQYEVCKRVLEKELSAKPGEETRGLYERIRSGDWPSSRSLAEAAVTIVECVPKHNLPVQRNSFIGREKEIGEIRGILTSGNARLVTLTGSGGCGKTRLALEVAGGLIDAFPDGVWLVELAPLSDPDKVPAVVASALGLQPQGNTPVLEILANYLQKRRMLLLLDNCEHLLDACARLVDHLLRACTGLVVLASSREGLAIDGEVSYRVPSLSIPGTSESPGVETIAQSEAARLFISRATQKSSGFQATPQNAPAIAQVCRRLDGIPLAIELAAARVAAMTVEQIAARLSDCFRLLIGGSRTALPRQKTLRASIDWSYNLLNERERLLLQRLSVFSGGWILEAAETVCGVGGIEPTAVLDLLTGLAEKSLVVFQGGAAEEQELEPRYHLLETIRQYARDILAAGEERADGYRMHLVYFRDLVELAEAESKGPRQLYWLRRLAAELENLRAAVQWGLEDPDPDSFPSGLRLVAAMAMLDLNIHAQEGYGWLEQYLSQQERMQQIPPGILARAFLAEGRLWMKHGVDTVSNDRACQAFAKSLSLYQSLGDAKRQVDILCNLSYLACWRDDPLVPKGYLEQAFTLARLAGISQEKWGLLMWEKGFFGSSGTDQKADQKIAGQCLLESIEAYEKRGDRLGSLSPLIELGCWLTFEGDIELAVPYLQKAVAASREMNSLSNLQWALIKSGDNAYLRDCFDQMDAFFSEAQQVCERTGFQIGYYWSTNHAGVAARRLGHLERAIRLIYQGMDLGAQNDWQNWRHLSVGCLVGLAADLGRWEEWARLFGFLTMFWEQYQWIYLPSREMYRDMPVVRSALGEEAFDSAFAQGKSLTWETAIELLRESVVRT